MNLVDTLCGRGRTWKATRSSIPRIRPVPSRQTHTVRKQADGCRGGAGNGERPVMAMGFRFGVIRRFWNWAMVMVTQHCEATLCHRIVHFKLVNMANFRLCAFHPNFKITHMRGNGITLGMVQGCWCMPLCPWLNQLCRTAQVSRCTQMSPHCHPALSPGSSPAPHNCVLIPSGSV